MPMNAIVNHLLPSSRVGIILRRSGHARRKESTDAGEPHVPALKSICPSSGVTIAACHTLARYSTKVHDGNFVHGSSTQEI